MHNEQQSLRCLLPVFEPSSINKISANNSWGVFCNILYTVLNNTLSRSSRNGIIILTSGKSPYIIFLHLKQYEPHWHECYDGFEVLRAKSTIIKRYLSQMWNYYTTELTNYHNPALKGRRIFNHTNLQMFCKTGSSSESFVKMMFVLIIRYLTPSIWYHLTMCFLL